MMFRSLLYPDFIYFYLSGENPYTKATAAASPHSFRLLRCLSGSQTCIQHSKSKSHVRHPLPWQGRRAEKPVSVYLETGQSGGNISVELVTAWCSTKAREHQAKRENIQQSGGGISE
ncbi:hypothetical protein QW71_32675 [Paenibacillus sp. IHB B 3415]|nr:hypothetical protein QW71_32675 [Paenibacillus sp. IHB B 3415]